MTDIIYFYNYTVVKTGFYSKFNHGTIIVTIPDGGTHDPCDVYQHVVDEAAKLYPDNDTVDITALNRL